MAKADAERLRAFKHACEANTAQGIEFQQRAEAAEAELRRMKSLGFHKAEGGLQKYKAEAERLREALRPFSIFAHAVERRFDLHKHLEPVVTIDDQALVVGAFIHARNALQENSDND